MCMKIFDAENIFFFFDILTNLQGFYLNHFFQQFNLNLLGFWRFTEISLN